MTIAQNPRVAYGKALVALGRHHSELVVLEADLGKSTQSVMFKAEFPERYFELGIAEQNMASVAAGLALTGKIPFIHSFAVFASGRIYDQLRNSVCIPNLPVRICGSSAGLSDFGDGKTHQAVEDIALMRALPNMTVLCPADSIELSKMMDCLVDWPGPVYLRVNRNDLPFVYPENDSYQIGEIRRLRDGSDAAIFASGLMVSLALQAAESLAATGIETRVIAVGTLKPFDEAAVCQQAAGVRAVLTAEEHSLIGGLGAAVAAALRHQRGQVLDFVGIKDCFGTSAESYDVILADYGLSSGAIIEALQALLRI